MKTKTKNTLKNAGLSILAIAALLLPGILLHDNLGIDHWLTQGYAGLFVIVFMLVAMEITGITNWRKR